MTEYDVWYGSAGSLSPEERIEADGIRIEQIDGEGSRRLEAWNEDPPGTEHGNDTVYEVTVGPDHVLGYRAAPGEDGEGG